MTFKTLGQSDLNITPIGVGAWAIGGGNWEFGWGPQDDGQSTDAIRAALDNGMNWIDTAAAYGLGHSESIVGRAIKGLPARPYVFTKCSLVWDASRNISHSLQTESILRECDGSLKRLNIEQIDLYQIHWPSWKASQGSIEEAMGALAKLRSQGKIRHIGVSNFDAGQMRRALDIAPVVSLQPPYSLVDREIESSILPFALRNNIGVIVYSPMASGLLSGAMTPERIGAMPQDDWRRRNKNFQEPLLSQNLRLVEKLRAVGRRYNATPGEVAIAWTLRNPAVTAAIVGVRRGDQVRGIANAAGIHLTANDLSEIEGELAAQA